MVKNKSSNIKNSITAHKKGWYYRLSLQKRMSIWGLIFLSPWLIGFLVFFLKPAVEVFVYAFNKISIQPKGLEMKWLGFKNFIDALTVDPNFNKELVETLGATLLSVPIIVCFSLLAAILLNGNYKGRGIARGIFFIPIILATGITTLKLGGAAAGQLNDVAQQTESVFGTSFISNILVNSGFDKSIVEYITKLVSQIFTIISLSGVQILIFLAGLQSISPSLYEVCKIEGATAYETFWKVTFPMVSPMILTVTVYSLADSFMRSGITQTIQDIGFKQGNYGLSAAMSAIYLLINVIIISVIGFIISRKVFYYD